MRGFCVCLWLISSFPVLLFAYGRSGDLADPVFLHTGTEVMGLSVSVGTITPTIVYDSNNSGYVDREILLQNNSDDYFVFCGTHTTFTESSGNRWLLPKRPGSFTTNAWTDIYCLGESAAGGDVEVIGSVEYDPKD